MVEDYEVRGACTRCLHNSVIASLLGFILVLIGGGAFGGATIFARRHLVDLLNAPNLFPGLDYTIYALIGAVGLFTVLAYILCTLSSGWNARHCFESSAKSACGRCCNMSFIFLLVCAIILWIAMASLMSYPVVSISLLLYRNERVHQFDRNMLTDMSELTNRILPSGQPQQLVHTPEWPQLSRNSLQQVTYKDHSMLLKEQPQRVRRQTQSWSDTFENNQPNAVDNDVNSIPMVEINDLNKIGESVRPGREWADRTGLDAQNVIDDVAQKALQSGRELLPCNSDLVDLSYYGLYDDHDKPILVSRATIDDGIKNVLICVCISLAGIFLLLLGYIQIVICTAMNYARFQEKRYYEASDAGEEGVALQQ